jgi:hypothetical protein
MSRKRGPIETPEYGKMVVRMIRAYAKRVTHADEPDLAQMLAVRDEMDKAIVAAIHGQRTVYDRSWSDIAAATGTTRQAAQQRWGKKVNKLDAELHGLGATRPGDSRDNGGEPESQQTGIDMIRELVTF